MTLPNEIDVLADVAGRLDALQMHYMLTGSLAMSYYAEPRMTRDIDLVVALSSADASRFAAAFAGDYYVPDDLQGAISTDLFFNLIHFDSVTKVDIIVRKNTPYRVHEFERRRRVNVAGLWVWIVSKEDLIVSKLDWAKDSRSEIQIRDARNLVATGCDQAYVENWVRQLDLEQVWLEVKFG